MKVSLVEDKSQPFWCFRPPRSLPSSLRQPAELLKCGCGLLGSLASRLGQEDEDEDEAEETDAAVEEEGGSVAKRVLQVKKSQGLKQQPGPVTFTDRNRVLAGLYELGLPAGLGKSW